MTLVITDVDDQIPTFNRNNFTVAVPEDVGNKSEFLNILGLFVNVNIKY